MVEAGVVIDDLTCTISVNEDRTVAVIGSGAALNTFFKLWQVGVLSQAALPAGRISA